MFVAVAHKVGSRKSKPPDPALHMTPFEYQRGVERLSHLLTLQPQSLKLDDHTESGQAPYGHRVRVYTHALGEYTISRPR